MRLDDQVCLFLQSKKLMDLGVHQDSLWSWFSFRNTSSPEQHRNIVHTIIKPSVETFNYSERSYLEDFKHYPAYTSSELGLMLPDDCRTYRVDDYWQSYWPNEGVMNMHQPFADENKTEAAAKAGLLIYLLEQKHITIADINSRLYLTL